MHTLGFTGDITKILYKVDVNMIRILCLASIVVIINQSVLILHACILYKFTYFQSHSILIDFLTKEEPRKKDKYII